MLLLRGQTNSTEPLLSELGFPIETLEALVTKDPAVVAGPSQVYDIQASRSADAMICY
jgi:hypothetical protein